jgi:O-antigen ligase
MWAYVISGVFQALFRAATDEAGNRTYTEDGSFDPNDVALFMVTAIPFAVHLIASAKSWIGRVMPMGMLAILLYGLVRTQSRGGFIAFVVVMGIFLLRGRMSMSVRAVAVAMAFIVLLGAGTKYWDRIETIWAPKTELDRGGSGRIAIWKEGAYLMLQRPWGWGIDTSTTAEGSQHQGGKWNAMHNSFLQVGVELGVVGAAAFVLLLGTTLRELRAVPKNASEYVGLASTLELSLYGFSVAAIFLSQAYGAFVYLLLGLSVAVIRMARRDEPETSALSTYQPARAAGYYYVPSGSSR